MDGPPLPSDRCRNDAARWSVALVAISLVTVAIPAIQAPPTVVPPVHRDTVPTGGFVVMDDGRMLSGGFSGAELFVPESRDRWIQQAAFDNGSGPVDLDGDTAVLATVGRCDWRGCDPGYVDVHRETADGWTHTATIEPDPAGDRIKFGRSVSLGGDLLAVGAPGVDQPGNDEGLVYVYERDAAGTWAETARLAPPQDQGTGFAVGLAADGDTVAVGAEHDDVVHIWRKVDGTWSLEQSVEPFQGGRDRFGQAVDLDGDTLLVGAPEGEIVSSREGLGYVFERTGPADGPGVWTFQSHLYPEGDVFRTKQFLGRSVALAGDIAVLGTDNGPGPRQGDAWVFLRSSGTWIQQEQLEPPEGPSKFAHFGRFVATDGRWIGATDDAGGVQIFEVPEPQLLDP